MPTPKYLLALFEENSFHHVICKSIAERRLFRNDENRTFFLNRYDHFLSNFVNTYSYCILSNHVHFLIRPRSIECICQYLRQGSQKKLTPTHRRFIGSNQMEMFHELIEQQFNRLFISYALNFNKQKNQVGHLFQRPFRRIFIEDDLHLTHLVIYIHANSLKHNITRDFTNYKWSSYQEIISNGSTHVCRNELLDWFGGKTNFIKTHLEQVAHYYSNPHSME